MDVDNIINPFELLGLDHKTCTLNDVRKAYRNLAFVCHPDKGGAAQDMRIVHTAYKWISTQLTEVRDRGCESYEDKEKAFKDFLDSQVDEKLVPFKEVICDGLGYSDAIFDEVYRELCDDPSEIKRSFAKNWVEGVLSYRYECNFYNDTQCEDVRELVRKELQRYVNKFQETSIEHASIQHGYGDIMTKDDTTPINSFGKSEMIVYKEPASNDTLHPQVSGVQQVARMDDYTFGNLLDYRMAYQEVDMPTENLEDTPQLDDEQKLEQLLHERKEDADKFTSHQSRMQKVLKFPST